MRALQALNVDKSDASRDGASLTTNGAILMAQEVTITFPRATLTATAFASTGRSKLGKRFEGRTIGIPITWADIPVNVLEDLLLGAVEDYCRYAVKQLDQENCTPEQVKAAMLARYDVLKSGRSASKKGKPRATDPVKAEVRKIIRQYFKDAHEASDVEGELDSHKVTKAITEMLNIHAKWIKGGRDAESDFANTGAWVDDVYTVARERVSAREAAASTLSPALLAALVKAPDAAEPAVQVAPPAKPKAKKTNKAATQAQGGPSV